MLNVHSMIPTRVFVAREFVQMVRQTRPILSDGGAVEQAPMTPKETATYESALDLMNRYFLNEIYSDDAVKPLDPPADPKGEGVSNPPTPPDAAGGSTEPGTPNTTGEACPDRKADPQRVS